VAKSGWKCTLLELTILVLIVCWLLSFFDQSLFPGNPRAGSYTDTLSILLLLLIMVRFLT
jgi:hypothetical protein